MARAKKPPKPPYYSKPYDRMKDERAEAWSCFIAYRGKNPEDRNFKELADDKGTTLAKVHEWYNKYDWAARAKAWDEEKERQLRWQRLRAVEKMDDRQSAFGLSCQQLAFQEMRKLMNKVEKYPNECILKPGQIMQIADMGARMERLARGEPIEIIEARGGGDDLGKLTIEQIKQLREIKKAIKSKKDEEDGGS